VCVCVVCGVWCMGVGMGMGDRYGCGYGCRGMRCRDAEVQRGRGEWGAYCIILLYWVIII
jgi:hypothetical protein